MTSNNTIRTVTIAKGVHRGEECNPYERVTHNLRNECSAHPSYNTHAVALKHYTPVISQYTYEDTFRTRPLKRRSDGIVCNHNSKKLEILRMDPVRMVWLHHTVYTVEYRVSSTAIWLHAALLFRPTNGAFLSRRPSLNWPNSCPVVSTS